jgi:hypothetical protein
MMIGEEIYPNPSFHLIPLFLIKANHQPKKNSLIKFPALDVIGWCGSLAAQTALFALSPGLILRMVLAALVFF